MKLTEQNILDASTATYHMGAEIFVHHIGYSHFHSKKQILPPYLAPLTNSDPFSILFSIGLRGSYIWLVPPLLVMKR